MKTRIGKRLRFWQANSFAVLRWRVRGGHDSGDPIRYPNPPSWGSVIMVPPVDRCPVCDSPVSVVSVVADGWLVVCEYDHQTILPDSQLTETLV